MTKFKLHGNDRSKYGFNVEIERNGTREKHKIHLEGGKIIDVNDIDVKLQENGVVKRIKIIPESILDQLREIAEEAPNFVKFFEDKKAKAKKED